MSADGATGIADGVAGVASRRLAARRPAPRDLLRLTKPRITLLVLVTAAAGYLAASGRAVDGRGLLLTLAGVALLAGGTNALNQLLERDADARMPRTRARPLPAGRVSPRAAALLSGCLVAGGALILLAGVNVLTAVLGLVTVLTYAFAYTPLKRHSSVALLVGAVPGALPILGGWTAARGDLGPGGWALFAILFLWQMPHFLALGWRYREEYRRAGFVMIPEADDDGAVVGLRAVAYALLLLPAGLAPAVLGVAGPVYAAAAGVLGLAYLASAAVFALRRSRRSARRLFRVSLIYLPLLLLLLVVDGSTVSLEALGLAGAPPLATLNAGLNAVTAVLLAVGFAHVRRGRIRAHRRAMLAATCTSAAFLVSYVVYHYTAGSVPYEGVGWTRYVYFTVLVSHVILAAAVVPLVLVTLYRALRGRRNAHRRLARWTFPIWAYVSVTGLTVYLMLYA